jgi:nucleotide-binding universal stress UspA family protein
MPKILVPFDGSESARRAVRVAVDMAKNSPSTKIDLLHVLEWTPAGSHVDVSPEELAKEHAAKAEEAVRPAKEIAAKEGVSCGVVSRSGAPATEITDAVHEGGYDSVIMGTRGMGPVASLMVGSVAMKVIHMISVPVTLVK